MEKKSDEISLNYNMPNGRRKKALVSFGKQEPRRM